MKSIFVLLMVLVIHSYVFCQNSDSFRKAESPSWSPSIPKSFGNTLSSIRTEDQQNIFWKGTIAYKSNNLQPSVLENEVTDLELQESVALKQRDLGTLQRIWARDFTRDKQESRLVDGPSALPNYMSVARMINKITIIDSNTVSTSGTEYLQVVEEGKYLNKERQFFHTWTRRLAGWKLMTKASNLSDSPVSVPCPPHCLK